MKCEAIDRIPTEKAIRLLKDDGMEVDDEQAKIILDFLYEMAEIVIDQCLNQSNFVNLHNIKRG